MLKGIVSIIIFIIIAIAIIAMVILRFMYKGYRSFRDVQEEILNNGGKRYSRDEYVRYQREKREKNPFGEDYFRSSDSVKKDEKKQEKKNTARKTSTSSSVTIIDDRDTEEKRKIFDRNDGEYVEYEEVR